MMGDWIVINEIYTGLVWVLGNVVIAILLILAVLGLYFKLTLNEKAKADIEQLQTQISEIKKQNRGKH